MSKSFNLYNLPYRLQCVPRTVLRAVSVPHRPVSRSFFLPSKPVSPPAASVRVIKKYPNRRLYDTETSSYITVTEVKQLVMSSTPFVVRDVKTNEDLTRTILLQIILEEEAGGAPMFTEAALCNMIRFYGNAMQSFLGSHLERNVQAFMDMQVKLTEHKNGLTPESWAQFMSFPPPAMQGVLGNYVEQSQNMITQMQEQMKKQAEQVLGAFVPKR